MSRSLIVSASIVSISIAVLFNQTANGQLSEFCEDFENVDPASPTAIADLGYEVFASVFDENGEFIGGDGGPAPNGGNGFSSIIADVEDGGLFSLNIFSDYDSPIHNNPLETLESNVFIEQIPNANDVGSNWTYSFDYRRAADENGDDVGPADGATATAFIRVINATNFALEAEFTLDTAAGGLMFETGSIEVEILSNYVGNFFQVGFNNRATNFQPTGIYYDNISFKPTADCIVGDLNGDGVVTLLDVAPFVAAINAGAFICEADTNGDGMVSLLDVDAFILLL